MFYQLFVDDSIFSKLSVLLPFSLSLSLYFSLCSACMLFYRLWTIIKVNFLQQYPVKKRTLNHGSADYLMLLDFDRFHSCFHMHACLTGTRLSPAKPQTHTHSQHSTSLVWWEKSRESSFRSQVLRSSTHLNRTSPLLLNLLTRLLFPVHTWALFRNRK